MKKMFAACLTMLALTLTACDGGYKSAPVSITSPSSASGTAGSAYAITLTETGGTAPYTWSVASGSSLPAGLALNGTTGVISGTPTTAGTFTIMITVTDSSKPAKTATLSFTLTVAPPPVSLTTTTLSSGTVGTAYSQTLMASGGTSPYTWSVSNGTLPGGLALDSSTGVLSGTPTAAGTTQFTVEVTDAAGTTATQQLTFTAALAPLSGNALLQGQYFFKFDLFADNSPDRVSHEVYIGSIILDGAGNITAGESDFADDYYDINNESVTGSYAIGGDGRGIMTLNLAGANTQEFVIAVGAGAQGTVAPTARLLEVDASSDYMDEGLDYSTGFLQLQDPTAFTTAQLTGASVFGWSGDTEVYHSKNALSQQGGLALAGRLVVGNDYNLTSDSTADIATNQATDNNIALTGSVTADTSTVGTSTAFATYGRALLNLSSTSYASGVLPQQSVIYVIDANTSYVVSYPNNDPEPLFSGYLVKQSGTFTNGSLTGSSIAYGSSQSVGAEAKYYDADTLLLYGSSDAMVSRYTADGSGSFTTLTDQNTGGVISSALTGSSTYSVATSGRVTVSGGANPPVLWLSGPGRGFGVSQPTASGPWPMLLTLEPQSATTYSDATLNGDYVIGVEQPQSYLSALFSGEVHADGAGNLSGVVDFFSDGGAQLFGYDALTSASTTAMAANGRFTLNATYLSGSVQAGSEGLVFYMISPERAVGIDSTNGTASPAIVTLDPGQPAGQGWVNPCSPTTKKGKRVPAC